MRKFSELLESSILIGYCIYRMLLAVHLVAQNVKFAFENDAYEWVENHHFAEIEIALAIMAVTGLLTGRRTVFTFTVFFFVLRTAIAITAVTIDLHTVSAGKSISCNSFPSQSNCKWNDALIAIQDILTFISLTMMSAVVFLRLLYLMPEGNYHRNDTRKQNYHLEHKQIKLPFSIKFDEQRKHEQDYKYYNDYSDNPYKSSVI